MVRNTSFYIELVSLTYGRFVVLTVAFHLIRTQGLLKLGVKMNVKSIIM